MLAMSPEALIVIPIVVDADGAQIEDGLVAAVKRDVAIPVPIKVSAN